MEISDCQGSAVPLPSQGGRHRVTFGNGAMVGNPHSLYFRFSAETPWALRVLAVREEHGAVFQGLGAFDGILGLARTTDHRPFSFLHYVFSLSLSSGFIHLGVSSELPVGFRRFPLIGREFWILKGAGISATGGSGGSGGGEYQIVLDSGTVETALPPDIFRSFGDMSELTLTLRDHEGTRHRLRIKPECKFIQLDLSGSIFEGAVVLGQSFFLGREVRFGPSWVDIQMLDDELANFLF